MIACKRVYLGPLGTIERCNMSPINRLFGRYKTRYTSIREFGTAHEEWTPGDKCMTLTLKILSLISYYSDCQLLQTLVDSHLHSYLTLH